MSELTFNVDRVINKQSTNNQPNNKTNIVIKKRMKNKGMQNNYTSHTVRACVCVKIKNIITLLKFLYLVVHVVGPSTSTSTGSSSNWQ